MLYESLFAVIRRLGLTSEALTEAFRRMVFNYLAMNCDDHSKNFSFLLNEQGKYILAPAYDVTFAYNSKSIWLKEHLMGVGGKFKDVSINDFKRFADQYKIPYAKKAIDDVKQSIKNWQIYAKNAGLSETSTKEIARYLC